MYDNRNDRELIKLASGNAFFNSLVGFVKFIILIAVFIQTINPNIAVWLSIITGHHLEQADTTTATTTTH